MRVPNISRVFAVVAMALPPGGSILASEYGGARLSGFLQVQIYG